MEIDRVVIVDKLKEGIKDFPKTAREAIIPASIMIIAWIVLGILNYMGVTGWWIVPLNFLTASLNGSEGGFLGIIGGIIAKLTLLMLITNTVMPMFKEFFAKDKEKMTYEQKKERVAKAIKKFSDKGKYLVGFVMIGIGVALIIYGFLTVTGSFQNSFVIILAMITTFRVLFVRASAVIRFFTALFRLTPVNNMPVYAVFFGLFLGFVISISMAAIFSSAILAYIIGITVCLIGYMLIKMEKKQRREI